MIHNVLLMYKRCESSGLSWDRSPWRKQVSSLTEAVTVFMVVPSTLKGFMKLIKVQECVSCFKLFDFHHLQVYFVCLLNSIAGLLFRLMPTVSQTFITQHQRWASLMFVCLNGSKSLQPGSKVWWKDWNQRSGGCLRKTLMPIVLFDSYKRV